MHIGRWSDEEFFSDGSVASEKKFLKFIGCGETYALGFWGSGNGAMWC